MPGGTGPVSVNASVDNAFAVLTCFAGTTEPIALTELSRMLGLPLTTTHRIVTTLCDAEFLNQLYSGGPYEPGIRVRELLNAMYNRYPVRRRATKVLRALADSSGQAAVLYVRFGEHILRIAGAQDRQQVHRSLLIGEALALDSSPSGLVMLSFPGDEQSHGVSGGLAAQIAEIRQAGFLSTASDTLRTIVFPLFNDHREAFAAISLEGSTLEFERPSKRQIAGWAAIIAEFQKLCAAHPEWTFAPFQRAGTRDLRLPSVTDA
jgi:DNA-binding IclR family transcriptional regulator